MKSVDQSGAQQRGIGRPSKAEAYRALVTNILAEEPGVLSLEILRRARLKDTRAGRARHMR